MRLRLAMSAVPVLACLPLLVSLSGCGGDSNTTPTPLPTPTPRPTPLTTTLTQGSFTGLEPGFVLAVPFTVTFSGEVLAIVDWTFASSDLDVAFARGVNPCRNSAGLFDPRICTFLAIDAGASKPKRLTAQLTPGEHTLYVENAGTAREALSAQVLLTYTPSATGPGAGLSSAAQSTQTAAQPTLLRRLRPLAD